MTDKKAGKNKGELSELYAFVKLLKDGKLYAADEDLNRYKDMYMPIVRIRREEKDEGMYDYHTAKDGETLIKIYHNDEFVKAVDINEFDVYSVCLYHALMRQDKGNQKIEEIGTLKSFLEEIFVKEVKTKSSKKADIVLEILDVYTKFKSFEGFSIKSQMGSASTLLNASQSTNFIYKLDGVDDELMNRVNAINTRTKIKDRISALKEKGIELKFHKMHSSVFKNNLILVDSALPLIVAEALKYYYVDGLKRCTDVVQKLCETNPLKYEVNWIYEYKFQKLLAASALGLMPADPWNGIEEASGGYIVVKSDGDIVACYLRNRNVFEQYLLKCTDFETPSTTKHNFASIYKENNEYYMNLNLQIRFQA